ncbi:MAG: ATPase, T2SS/T4P/T4SS family [Alphaproteobacteria bacterium]
MRKINPLLHAALQKLAAYYSREGLEEIAINRPCEVWLKHAGTSDAKAAASHSGWEAVNAPEITYEYIEDLCIQLANVTMQQFDPINNPILYADLPEGHRFTAILGRNVQYDNFDDKGCAVNIRIFSESKSVGFDRFGLEKGMPLEEGEAHGEEMGGGRTRYSDSPLEDLVGAVQNGEAILISGATATGKTTFLNNLIDKIERDRRIVTVEDVRELKVEHKNRVHLVASRTKSATSVDDRKLLDIVVRMTPDVLMCGEIGINNAPGIYRLMTTGHSNFMCTIHADSPETAIKAFWQNLSQSMQGLDPAAVMDVISSGFGRIVQIEREGRKRIVTAIDMPKISVNELTDSATVTAPEEAAPGQQPQQPQAQPTQQAALQTPPMQQPIAQQQAIPPAQPQAPQPAAAPQQAAVQTPPMQQPIAQQQAIPPAQPQAPQPAAAPQQAVVQTPPMQQPVAQQQAIPPAQPQAPHPVAAPQQTVIQTPPMQQPVAQQQAIPPVQPQAPQQAPAQPPQPTNAQPDIGHIISSPLEHNGTIPPTSSGEPTT